MANYCDYEIRVKGSKKAGLMVYESMPCMSNKDLDWDKKDGTDYLTAFSGDCKWSVNYGVIDDTPIINIDAMSESEIKKVGEKFTVYSLKAKSKALQCEIMAHYWSEEGGFDQFDHYKNGKLLKQRKVACIEDEQAEFDWDSLEYVGHEGEYNESVDGEEQSIRFITNIARMHEEAFRRISEEKKSVPNDYKQASKPTTAKANADSANIKTVRGKVSQTTATEDIRFIVDDAFSIIVPKGMTYSTDKDDLLDGEFSFAMYKQYPNKDLLLDDSFFMEYSAAKVRFKFSEIHREVKFDLSNAAARKEAENFALNVIYSHKYANVLGEAFIVKSDKKAVIAATQEGYLGNALIILALPAGMYVGMYYIADADVLFENYDNAPPAEYKKAAIKYLSTIEAVTTSAPAKTAANSKSASTNTSAKTKNTKQDQKTKEQKLEEEYNKALEDRKAEIARRTEEEKERLQKILDSEIEQAEKRHEAEINKLDEDKEQKKQKIAELQRELDGLGFLKFKRKSELKDLIAEANRDLNATVRRIDDAEKGNKKSLERSRRAYEINFEDFTRKVEELVPAPKEPEHMIKRREEERKKKELREKKIEDEIVVNRIKDYLWDNGPSTVRNFQEHINYFRQQENKAPLSTKEIIELMKEPKENGYIKTVVINGITYYMT